MIIENKVSEKYELYASAGKSFIDFVITVDQTYEGFINDSSNVIIRQIQIFDSLESEIYTDKTGNFLGISVSMVAPKVMLEKGIKVVKQPGKVKLEQEDIDRIVNWPVSWVGDWFCIGSFDGDIFQVHPKLAISQRKGLFAGLLFLKIREWVSY